MNLKQFIEASKEFVQDAETFGYEAYADLLADAGAELDNSELVKLAEIISKASISD